MDFTDKIITYYIDLKFAVQKVFNLGSCIVRRWVGTVFTNWGTFTGFRVHPVSPDWYLQSRVSDHGTC